MPRAPAAQVGVGRRLNDNIYLGVRQGTTPGSSRVTVDVDVTRNIRLQGATGADGSAEVGIGAQWDYEFRHFASRMILILRYPAKPGLEGCSSGCTRTSHPSRLAALAPQDEDALWGRPFRPSVDASLLPLPLVDVI